MTHHGNEPVEHPDLPVRRRAIVSPPPENIIIYIAGSTHTPSGGRPRAAAAILIESEEARNIGRCIPSASEQSQYVAELFAALAAVRSASKDSILTIISTQNCLSDTMNKKLAKWEQHRDVLRCLAAELKVREVTTFFKMAISGSPLRTLCQQAADLAKRAAQAPLDEQWDLTLPQNTALPGMSLQGKRQRVFYRSIREEKTRTLVPRQSTLNKLETVREAVKNVFGRHLSDAEIWRVVSTKRYTPTTGPVPLERSPYCP
jgi:hypothetical protein